MRTSSSFPSAHVFPGGNLSAEHDGAIPGPEEAERHVDGKAYRVGAIRECFEESGILLAKNAAGGDALLDVEESVREKGRKEIHAGKVRFGDWVKEQRGVIDTGSSPFPFQHFDTMRCDADYSAEALIPFTRWITPTNLPKRFTTQMYIYFLPLSTSITSKSSIPIPTSDGGLEHTAALFAPCSTWLSQARSNSIILFPPQFYLMYLLAPFLTPSFTSSTLSSKELQAQRDKVVAFLKGDGGDGTSIEWKDKVMSPIGLMMRKSDGRSVLGLDKPGPELNGSGRGGDEKRVVLVKFGKEGPRDVEVMDRKLVLDAERKEKL